MKIEEFSTHMNRLVSQFGKNAYSPERANLIWREVKDLPEPWFSKTVDELIGCSRQAPLLPDFREYISAERERQWSQRERVSPGMDWSQFTSCDSCWGNGVYLCVKTAALHEGFYAFRCHCSKGYNDPRKAIPQFKSDHAKEFVWFDARKLAELRARSMP